MTEEEIREYVKTGRGLMSFDHVRTLLTLLDAARAELAAVGATTAPLYTSQEREVLVRELDALRESCEGKQSWIESVGRALAEADPDFRASGGVVEHGIRVADRVRVLCAQRNTALDRLAAMSEYPGDHHGITAWVPLAACVKADEKLAALQSEIAVLGNAMARAHNEAKTAELRMAKARFDAIELAARVCDEEAAEWADSDNEDGQAAALGCANEIRSRVCNGALR